MYIISKASSNMRLLNEDTGVFGVVNFVMFFFKLLFCILIKTNGKSHRTSSSSPQGKITPTIPLIQCRGALSQLDVRSHAIASSNIKLSL